MKKPIVKPSLLKAHVKSYTRKDGTFVQEHDDGRQAAAPKPAMASRKPKADPYGHPNVVGHAKMTRHEYKPGGGVNTHKDVEAEDPADADTAHFNGKRYSWTSKTGKSMHDGTELRAFEHEESGHRIWVDSKRRVHADSADEVKGLRAEYEAHAKKAKPGRLKKTLLVVRPDLLKAHVGSYIRKDGTFVKEHDRQIEAHGVKGMKSTPWRKTFKSQKHFEDWLDKNDGNVEVHGTREVEQPVKAAKPAAEAPSRSGSRPKFQEGDTVKVTGNVRGAGKTGFIHSTAPSGSFHIVEHADGSRSSYHESDLAHHDPDDDEDDDDDRDR